MKLTNKKIVGGVIALLAVVSVVQTQAIVKIAKDSNTNNSSRLATVSPEDQTAQVLSTARQCAEILPVDGTETSIDYPSAAHDMEGNVADNMHTFHINFKVKNRCANNIYILGDIGSIIPGFYTDPGDVFPGEIQEYNPLFQYNESSPIVPATNIGERSAVIWGHGSNLFSSSYLFTDLEIPNSNFSGISLMNIEGWGQDSRNGYLVPPQMERFFIFQSFVGVDNATFPENNPKAYRMKLKKIRWFTQASYSDGVLTANELKTYFVPQGLYKSITTSYITFWKSPFSNPQLNLQSSKEVPEAIKNTFDKALKSFTNLKTQKKN